MVKIVVYVLIFVLVASSLLSSALFFF
ncbi:MULTISPECIES: hypothetical protein [Brochothrix]